MNAPIGRLADSLTLPSPYLLFLGDTTEAGLAARMAPYLQTLASGFGTLTAVRHSGVLGGVAMPWRYLSMPPGSAAPQWP